MEYVPVAFMVRGYVLGLASGMGIVAIIWFLCSFIEQKGEKK